MRAKSVVGVSPGDAGVASMFMAPSATGVPVTPATAMQIPAFAACVRLLSDTVGTVPLDVFERIDEATRERRPDSGLAQLLQKPNAALTGLDFRRWAMQQILRHGNAYARIQWAGNGQPTMLEPLPAGRVTPFLPVGTSRLWYRYTSLWGGSETLSDEDVLHIRGPLMGEDGFVSLSPVDLFRETIGLASAQVQYLARFFANNAVPKGALKVPSGLNDETVELIRTSWENRHKGLENAHRLAILDHGMSFEELGMSHSDAQLVEGYRHSTAQIASIFGIPLHMIGDTGATSNWGTGVEQHSIGFIMYVVRPYYEAIETALDHALMSDATRRRFYFEHNADGLLRGDFKSRMDAYALCIQWGLHTPNEVRRLMNYPPLPGGDQRLQPLNMAPADLVKQILLRDPATARRALVDAVAGELPKTETMSDAAA